MAFYSDIRREPLRTRVSNYLLTFSRHFDIYRNSRLVASVDYGQIPWC
jgi:hypothetical protein